MSPRAHVPDAAFSVNTGSSARHFRPPNTYNSLRHHDCRFTKPNPVGPQVSAKPLITVPVLWTCQRVGNQGNHPDIRACPRVTQDRKTVNLGSRIAGTPAVKKSADPAVDRISYLPSRFEDAQPRVTSPDYILVATNWTYF